MTKVMPGDIVQLKHDAPLADAIEGNGRYWIVERVHEQYIEIASLYTGKRNGTTIDEIATVFRSDKNMRSLMISSFLRIIDALSQNMSID